MIFRCLSKPFMVVILLCIFFYTDLGADTKHLEMDLPERINDSRSIDIPKKSVLQLIPDNTLALIYCPSLKLLNNKINIMVSELMSQEDSEMELLAKIIAYAIGLDFERLDSLEELGLDFEKDVVVFFTSFDPVHISTALHLKDPEIMKELITSEAEDLPSNTYKGATYWSTIDGMKNFAILDEYFLFSQQIDVCINMIDIRNGTIESKKPNQDYEIFLSDVLNNSNDISYFYDSIGIKTSPHRSLMEELESDKGNFEGQNNQRLKMIYNKFFGSVGTYLNDKFQSISGSVQFQETDIILKQFLHIENESKLLDTDGIIMMGENGYYQLPETSILKGSIQGSPELIGMMSKLLLYNFPKDTPEQSDKLGHLQQELQLFHSSMVDGVQGSVNFEDSLLPDYLFIYDVKDEMKAKTYIDVDFSEAISGFYGAQKGVPIIHTDVEIGSYVFPELIPTIAKKEPNQSEILPFEWNLYYAFKNGKLYFSMASEPMMLKLALDKNALTRIESSISESEQKLIDNLDTDSNILLLFSPIIAVKKIMPLLAKMDMPGAYSLNAYTVMFDSLPDNYSIGFSAKTEAEGINTKLMITLGDFKSLFQFLSVMFSTESTD
ncbi:hypothetical protein C6497_04820 [Candidatus Poribacteria bacterium]|nr:MAG: hypothetical protein C6497_04820 [Candidatus Poribacteria bacterium]